MVITRFAPSPTGQLHLGTVRTALFNWLWARKNSGQFILRLEDTDRQRLVPGADRQILADLRWLGLDWDWGPDQAHPKWGEAVQSRRRDSYRQAAERLIDLGVAYYDQTPPEKLELLRQQAAEQKRPFVFRRSMADYRPDSDRPATVRVAVPDDLEISWTDQVKGRQRWRGGDIGDFVILKSDGWPTYQLANVVDDQAMAISHVIRADEWLSSTPKHLYLFDRLGWDRPTYAHVPPVLAETGNRKLSKRDGGGVNIDDCRQAGYPPPAIANCLAFLGWHPGHDREIFALEELAEAFSLDRLQTAAARFDPRRLDWLGGQHIRRQSRTQRGQTARDWWPKAADDFSDDYRQGVLDLVFERLRKWSELAELTGYFFADPNPWTEDTVAAETKLSRAVAAKTATESKKLLADCRGNELEAELRQLADRLEIKAGQLFMVLRIRLTGQTKTPNLLDIISQLGPETCRRRLELQPEK